MLRTKETVALVGHSPPLVLLKVGVELSEHLFMISQNNNWLIVQTIWAVVAAGKAEPWITSKEPH